MDILNDARFNMSKVKGIAKTYIDLFSEEKQNFDHVNRIWLLQYKDAFMNMVLGWDKDIYKCEDVQEKVWKSLGFLNQRLYLETHKNGLPTLLRNYDRYSMASGVEIRMQPYFWKKFF